MSRAHVTIHGGNHGRKGPDPLTWDELLQTWSTQGTLTVTAGVIPWYPPVSGTIDYIHVALGVGPSGGTVGLRVNSNGTSVGTITFSTGPTFGTFVPTDTTFGTSDRYTVDVYAVGTSTAGGHAVVQLWGKFR